MKLKIDSTLFRMAFERDVDYHDTTPQSPTLDLSSGDILWVYENDEDAESDGGRPAEENSELQNRIKSNPENYLLIPGLSHGQHHDLLKEFLESHWAEHEGHRLSVKDEYFGSIGGWKESIIEHYDNADEILNTWLRIKEQRIDDMMNEFLSDHGVESDLS